MSKENNHNSTRRKSQNENNEPSGPFMTTSHSILFPTNENNYSVPVSTRRATRNNVIVDDDDDVIKAQLRISSKPIHPGIITVDNVVPAVEPASIIKPVSNRGTSNGVVPIIQTNIINDSITTTKKSRGILGHKKKQIPTKGKSYAGATRHTVSLVPIVKNPRQKTLVNKSDNNVPKIKSGFVQTSITTTTTTNPGAVHHAPSSLQSIRIRYKENRMQQQQQQQVDRHQDDEVNETFLQQMDEEDYNNDDDDGGGGHEETVPNAPNNNNNNHHHHNIHIDESSLVVATEISPEKDRHSKILGQAIEYDPNSKPPLYKNRRFRVYATSASLLLLLAIIAAIVGSLSSRSAPIVSPTDSPTEAPSLAPSTTRNLNIRLFLASILGNNAVVFDEPDSPQYRAATWIIEEDEMQLDEMMATNFLQRYIMALFYFSTTNNEMTPWRSCGRSTTNTCDFIRTTPETDGSGLVIEVIPNETSWLSNVHECQWAGIQCDGVEIIRSLELWRHNITSTLPSELAQIPFLQVISLPFNEIYGTLPVEYGSMEHLVRLELHNNSLSGTLPEEYYQLSALRQINLGDNGALNGTISTSIGKLVNLGGFFLFGNQFTGSIPTEIGRVESLALTRFQENALVGPLPSELGRLTLLRQLRMHQNALTGSIPDTFAALTALTELRLGRNNLVGPIPEFIFDFTQLSLLELEANFLTGTLSTRIGELRFLSNLQIERNRLHGTIPTELASLFNLVQARLHLNEFTGSIPSSICNLRRFNLCVLNADCTEGFLISSTPCPCCTSCCNRMTEICRIQENNVLRSCLTIA